MDFQSILSSLLSERLVISKYIDVNRHFSTLNIEVNDVNVLFWRKSTLYIEINDKD